MVGAIVLQCLCAHASYNLLKRFALVCKKSSQDALAEIAARDAERIPDPQIRWGRFERSGKIANLEEFEAVSVDLVHRYGARCIPHLVSDSDTKANSVLLDDIQRKCGIQAPRMTNKKLCDPLFVRRLLTVPKEALVELKREGLSFDEFAIKALFKQMFRYRLSGVEAGLIPPKAPGILMGIREPTQLKEALEAGMRPFNSEDAFVSLADYFNRLKYLPEGYILPSEVFDLTDVRLETVYGCMKHMDGIGFFNFSLILLDLAPRLTDAIMDLSLSHESGITTMRTILDKGWNSPEPFHQTWPGDWSVFLPDDLEKLRKANVCTKMSMIRKQKPFWRLRGLCKACIHQRVFQSNIHHHDALFDAVDNCGEDIASVALEFCIKKGIPEAWVSRYGKITDPRLARLAATEGYENLLGYTDEKVRKVIELRAELEALKWKKRKLMDEMDTIVAFE